MKRFKKYVVYLTLSLSLAALAVGCKKKTDETESESEEQITESDTPDTEIEEVTGTTTQTKLYTAKDKSFSITLPDSSWKNTKDTEESLVFEADEGSITITHLTGSSATSVQLPESEEEVLENFTSAGKDADYYEVLDFEKKTSGSTAQYHTLIKCSDSDESYVYSVGYDIATGSEIYSVTGLVFDDDEDVLEAVQTSVESFKILSTSDDDTDSDSDQSSDSDEGSDSAQTGDTMVIYDSNGNAITVTKNADGTWSDSTGKTYDMQQYGVMGSDGYWYTYSASSTSETSASDNNNSTNSDDSSTTTANTSGFYDQDGNYISVTQDDNGNWVDSYGTTYYFGDSGVTDNAGNYYPYQDSGESTGFYDSNGNYITVTKNSNGEWVDSNGATYVFGETGVTDEAGNFYPY